MWCSLRQPNFLLHLTHRLGDDGQEAGGSVAEDVVHFVRQGEELVVALAGGGVVGDQALGQQALHVGAAGEGVALVLPELFVVGAHQLVQLADVAGVGVPRVALEWALGVGHGAHHLLGNHGGVTQDVDGVADRLAHLLLAVGAQHYGGGGEDGFWLWEGVAELVVERTRDLAAQLEVCGLILAHRHHARLRQENIGRLQDRVGEEAVVDVVGLLRLLLLIGRSALDPAHRRDGHQDPGELLHLGAMALHKEGALVRGRSPGAAPRSAGSPNRRGSAA
jgi:hypothetical protein